ncbi:ABC transporter ATP-binding protein [Planctomycetota bacterium]
MSRSSKTETERARAPAYVLEDVTFAYDGKTVVDVPRLQIRRGEVTALVGANGSGKTTLLHLLAFLEAPTGGSITFLGQQATPALELRRRVGLLLQEPYLFHASVVRNVEVGLKVRGVSGRARRERAKAALEQVGLAGFEERDAAKLSGGEARRVALARVLALETDVLLLDEPMAHMDEHSARRTEELLLRLHREQGKTIVLASHDLLWAQALARRVLSLHRGSLVPASLANVFRGQVAADGVHFETGRLSIYLGGEGASGTHLAIDPSAIVLSREPLASSMRNTFQGRIVAISEEAARVRIEVDAGERVRVSITRESLRLLALHLGETVHLSFKSTAAQVF